MKKLLTLLSIFFVSLMIKPSDAQAQWQFGGGLAYADDMGINLSVIKPLDEVYKNLRGAVGVNYFFADGVDLSLEVNADTHYMFLAKDNLSAYGIVGVSYGYVSVKVGTVSISTTNTGLNVGAGADFGLSFGKAFGELRYILRGAGALGITAGVRIAL